MKQIWTQMNGYFLEMNSKRCTELKKLPTYSPLLNIEQSISTLKTAIKADISRPKGQQQMNNCEEATRQGIALGHDRTQHLL